MFIESDANAQFSRPSSIAIIGKNYLFCKCEHVDNCLYRFQIEGDGQLVFLDKLETKQSLRLIKSGTENIFFGVGTCGRVIYFYDVNLNLLGSYAFSLGSNITAVNYDTSLLRFYVAVSVGDLFSNINVCTLSCNLSLSIEDVYKVSTGNISGLLFIDGFGFIVSDYAASQLYFYNPLSGTRKVFALFGRDGNGCVRAPGTLMFHKNYFAVIDRDNYLVQFYNFQGVFIGQIGGKGIALSSLDFPSDMVIHNDLMIIADMNNDRLISYKYINQAWVGRTAFTRNFSPGKLSRPISARFIFNHLYIADRSNGRVQVFKENLDYLKHFPNDQKYLFRQPTSLCFIDFESRSCLAILSRNSNAGSAYITIIDAKTDSILLNKNLPELSDPQGMVECGSANLCVMDTLNRRALLYDNKLVLKSECNLAKLSQLDRFLCRVPSLIDGNLYFCDYHQGIVVVLDLFLNHIKTFDINMSRLKMSNIRKIEKISKHFLIIGRGEHELTIVFDDLLEGRVSFFEKSIFPSVVDVCFSPKGNVYFLLKERDAVLKYSIDDFLELAK